MRLSHQVDRSLLEFFFRAYAGDENGSVFLQAFATFLHDQYIRRPLDRIYLMVKQAMIKAEQVELVYPRIFKTIIVIYNLQISNH